MNVLFLFTFLLLNSQNQQSDISIEKLVKDINTLRSKSCHCGSKPMKPVRDVKWNAKLQQAAFKHATYLSKKKKLSHYGQAKSQPGDRITAEKYTWKACAENVASGEIFLDQFSVLEAWMQSPIHCENIMNNAYTEIGLGVVNGYWVLVLADSLK